MGMVKKLIRLQFDKPILQLREELARRLRRRNNLNVNHRLLLTIKLENKVLRDEETICQLGIESNNVLLYDMIDVDNENNIYIETANNGEKISIPYNQNDTIQGLKQKIGQKENIPPEQQILKYNGKN